MKKAIIIHQSKNGTTRQLGNEISNFLTQKGIRAKSLSVNEFADHDLSHFDYIFLGCWTKGLMIFAQHPDKTWKEFVKTLDIPENANIALFTTYKIATGSMFSKMRKHVPGNNRANVLEIKSRNGRLSKRTASLMGQYIA